MTNAPAILATPPTDPAARAAWIKKNVPTDPHSRAVWVRAQLSLRGENFSSLARHAGKDRRAIAMAMRVPAYPMEGVVAKAVGLTVPELFPERYTADGKTRLHRVRSDLPNHNPRHGARNV